MENNSSGLPYVSSMAIIALSVICYQIFQKNIVSNIHPVVSVIISYVIALICSIALLFVFPLKGGIIAELQKANYATYLVGVAIIGIEIGFLLVYRNGWKLSSALSVSSSISITTLAIIGFIFFKENITLPKILGIILCVSGIYLLNR
jgi:drug/metabolite transporter (DMT)-like permease